MEDEEITLAPNERNLSFLGDIAQIIPEITGQFNKDYQANQLAIAQANAQQSAANAQAETMRAQNNTSGRTAWVVGGVAVAVVILVIILKS